MLWLVCLSTTLAAEDTTTVPERNITLLSRSTITNEATYQQKSGTLPVIGSVLSVSLGTKSLFSVKVIGNDPIKRTFTVRDTNRSLASTQGTVGLNLSQAKLSPFHLTAAPGITSVRYEETAQSNYDALELRLNVALNLQLGKRWEATWRNELTLLPFFSSRDETARTYTAHLTLISAPWALTPSFFLRGLFGAFYRTMFVSGSAFGIQNIYGPELLPRLEWFVAPADSLYFQFKYSPVMNGISFRGLSSREFGFTLGWSHYQEATLPAGISIEFSNLKLSGVDSEATARSFSLAGQMWW